MNHALSWIQCLRFFKRCTGSTGPVWLAYLILGDDSVGVSRLSPFEDDLLFVHAGLDGVQRNLTRHWQEMTSQDVKSHFIIIIFFLFFKKNTIRFLYSASYRLQASLLYADSNERAIRQAAVSDYAEI